VWARGLNLKNVQTSSGVNPAIPWGQEALAHGVKPPVCKTDHLPYLMLKLRMRTAIPCLLFNVT